MVNGIDLWAVPDDGKQSVFLPCSRLSGSVATLGLLCQTRQRGSRQSLQSGQNSLEFPLLPGGGFIELSRFWGKGLLIGIGAAVTHRPLPHHRAYESVHGGSIGYVSLDFHVSSRGCLDHMIVLNEALPRRTLSSYFSYYHRSKTHLSLQGCAGVSAGAVARIRKRRRRTGSRWSASALRTASRLNLLRSIRARRAGKCASTASV